MHEPVVVLLRGVNVGGHNKVPMAELRSALNEAGFVSVRTYVQSGNVVALHPSHDASTAADEVRAVLESAFGVSVPVLGVDRTELRRIIDANPYPAVTDHKRLHAIVLPSEPEEHDRAAVAQLQAASDSRGSRDAVAVIGRIAYLHTPDGFGTSDLARKLTGGRGPLAAGTARNWATMTALMAMADDRVTDP